MEDRPLIKTPTDKDKPTVQIAEDERESNDAKQDDPLLRGRIVNYWRAVSDWSID